MGFSSCMRSFPIRIRTRSHWASTALTASSNSLRSKGLARVRTAPKALLLGSLFLWLLLLVLPFYQRHTRAAGFAYQNRFGQYLGRGIGEIRARADDFPGREFNFARSATHLGDAAVDFDEVASVHGSQEFYLVVGAEKTLVAIETDAQFGAYVAKELQHLRAIDQVATIVGVVRTHPYPDHCRRQPINRFQHWHRNIPLSSFFTFPYLPIPPLDLDPAVIERGPAAEIG